MFKGLRSLIRKSTSHCRRLPLSFSISLFSSTPSKHASSSPSIKMFDYLLTRQNFSPEAAEKASSTVKQVRNLQRADSVLSFFKQIGFSQNHIEDLVGRFPEVLSAGLDNVLRPKIKVFLDLGFNPVDMADLLSNDPLLLRRSAENRLRPSLTVLLNILGSTEEVCRLLKLSNWFLKQDIEKIMLPNIEYLKGIGICSSQIVRYLFHYPRFFLLKQESISVYVSRVDEMGFDRKSNMYLPAIRVISSMSLERWHLKLNVFRSLGLSENDILVLFRRMPIAFAVSTRKVQEVTELLLSSGKCDMSYIVLHPELLLCSVERRLKPRLQIMDILEKKQLLRKRPPLVTICRLSNQRFSKRFLSPYSLEELNASMGAHELLNSFS